MKALSLGTPTANHSPHPPVVMRNRKGNKKRGRRLKNRGIAKLRKRRPKRLKQSGMTDESVVVRITLEEQLLVKRLETARENKTTLRKRLKQIAKQARFAKQVVVASACENATKHSCAAASTADDAIRLMLSNKHIKRCLALQFNRDIIRTVAENAVSEYILVARRLIVKTNEEIARQKALSEERRHRFPFIMPNMEKKSRIERLAATQIQAKVRQHQAVKVVMMLEDMREQHRQQEAIEKSMTILRHLVSNAKKEFDKMDGSKKGILHMMDTYELGRQVLGYYTPNGHPLGRAACDAWLRRWDSCVLAHIQEQKPIPEGFEIRAGLHRHELQDILLFVCCTYEYHQKLEAAITVQTVSRKHRAVQHVNKLRVAQAQERSTKRLWYAAQTIQACTRRRQALQKWAVVKTHRLEAYARRRATTKIQAQYRRRQASLAMRSVKIAWQQKQHEFEAATSIQAGIRGTLALKNIRVIKASVIALQRRVRMIKIQRQQEKIYAANIIQRNMQEYLQRIHCAAAAIQIFYSQYTSRQQCKQTAGKTIQTCIRIFLSRNRSRQLSACETIVTAIKRFVVIVQRQNAAAHVLQGFFHTWKDVQITAAVLIQSVARMYMSCKRKLRSANLIQAVVRSCLTRTRLQHAAALVMQSTARTYLKRRHTQRRAEATIMSAVHAHLARKRKRIAAITSIQAVVRSCLTRTRLQHAAALVMQSTARTYLKRRHTQRRAEATIMSAVHAHLARKRKRIAAISVIVRFLSETLQWVHKRRAAARTILVHMHRFTVANHRMKTYAAVTIQNTFRIHTGTIKERAMAIHIIRHRLRQVVRNKKAHRQRAALVIQTKYQAYRSAQNNALAIIITHLKNYNTEMSIKRDMAARRITSILRLHIIRRKKVSSSARVIIKCIRCHGRRMKMLRESAASAIQKAMQEYVKHITHRREAASLKISATMRTYIVRLRLEKNVAALMLQATLRSFVIREKQKFNEATIQIQCHYRIFRACAYATQLRRLREACVNRLRQDMKELVAIRLQCLYRRHVACSYVQCRRLQREKKAALQIRNLIKRFLWTRSSSATRIQACFRQIRTQDVKRSIAGIVLIQTQTRRMIVSKQLQAQQLAAITIQTIMRKQMTPTIDAYRSSSICIQSHIRRYASAEKVQVLRQASLHNARSQAAITIQASIRRSQIPSIEALRSASIRIQALCRSSFVEKVACARSNAVIIQKAFRLFRLLTITRARIVAREKAKTRKAAVTIQAIFRRWKVTDMIWYSSAALIVQSYCRRWLATIEVQKLRSDRNIRSAIKLQGCVRRWLNPNFKVAFEAVLVIQKYLRRLQATRIVARLIQIQQEGRIRSAMIASEKQGIGKDWRPFQKEVSVNNVDGGGEVFQFQFRKRPYVHADVTIQNNQDGDVFTIAHESRERRRFGVGMPMHIARRRAEFPVCGRRAMNSMQSTPKRRATRSNQNDTVYMELVAEQREEEREQKESQIERGRSELRDLLESLNLDRYLKGFVEEGYDNIGDIRGMGLNELMSDVHMKKGHARRLIHHFEDRTRRVHPHKDSVTKQIDPPHLSEQATDIIFQDGTTATSKMTDDSTGGAIRVIKHHIVEHGQAVDIDTKQAQNVSDIAHKDSHVRHVSDEITRLIKSKERAAQELRYCIAVAAAVAWDAVDGARDAMNGATLDLKSAQYRHFVVRAQQTQAAKEAKSAAKVVARAVLRYCNEEVQHTLNVVSATINQLTAHQPKRKERHQLSREERRLQRRRRQKRQADAAVKIQAVRRGGAVRNKLPERALFSALRKQIAPKSDRTRLPSQMQVDRQVPVRPTASPRKRRMQDRHRLLRRRSLLIENQPIPLIADSQASPLPAERVVHKEMEEKPIYRIEEQFVQPDAVKVAEQKSQRPEPACEMVTSGLPHSTEQVSSLNAVSGPSPRKQRQKFQIHDRQKKELAARDIQKHIRRYQTLSFLQYQHQHASLLVALKMESAVRTLQARFRASQEKLDVKKMVMDSDVVVAMPGTVQGQTGWYNMQGMIVQLQIKGGSDWQIRQGPLSIDQWNRQ